MASGSGQGGSGTHKFWDTQPVVQFDEDEADEVVEYDPDIRIGLPTTPLTLPAAFEWVDVDVEDPQMLAQVTEFLAGNYIQSPSGRFALQYGSDFISWALTGPGAKKSWQVAVLVRDTKQMVGFISGVPLLTSVFKSQRRMAFINFLAVHSSMRSKRLAPKLIEEVARRIGVSGVYHALYTSSSLLPRPVGQYKYWGRALDVDRMLKFDNVFIPPHVQQRRSEADRKKALRLYYRLPEEPSLRLRPITEDDMPAVYDLATAYFRQFKFHVSYTREEMAHWFLPRPGVLWMYGVEAAEGGELIAVGGFHGLRSLMKTEGEEYPVAFYNYLITPHGSARELAADLLVLARKEGFEYMASMGVMGWESWLEELKFTPGESLNMYFYNLRCPPLPASEFAYIVL